ncbi:MAG: alpha/beta hydrolase [Anaerolineaceae bacterium]
MSAQLVFVHSPLLGPESWLPVSSVVARRGWDVALSELRDNGHVPYWRQHVDSVVSGLRGGTVELVLAAHSGAGPLLGALAHELGERVTALLFVDAGIPEDGLSRLEMLRAEMGDAFGDTFQAHLEAGGRYPEWSDRDLAPIVSDAATRAAILRSQRPRTLDFWTEEIAAPAGWKARPCGYLQLSDGYSRPMRTARELEWPVVERITNHLALLTNPAAVADDLQSLLRSLGLTSR